MMNIEALLAYVMGTLPKSLWGKGPHGPVYFLSHWRPCRFVGGAGKRGRAPRAPQGSKKYAVPTFILGNGSNLLVRDGGIRGLVIKLGNHLNGLSACGVTMEAGAGVSLAQAARFAAESGLSGLEFAVGIPGSLGGAVIMNAGAYDGDMGHVVKSVTALNGTGEIVRLTQKDL